MIVSSNNQILEWHQAGEIEKLMHHRSILTRLVQRHQAVVEKLTDAEGLTASNELCDHVKNQIAFINQVIESGKSSQPAGE